MPEDSSSSNGGRKFLKAKLPKALQAEYVEKFMCTYTKNKKSGALKLLVYDLSKLVKYGGITTAFVRGTIFTMDNTLIGIMLLQLLISFLTGLLAWLDEGSANVDMEGLQELSRYLGSFVPFVLALYVSLSMQRWWSLRTEALGPVFTCMSNVCLQLSACLPGSRYEMLRENVLRYGLACTQLMVQAARKELDLAHLVEEEVLTQEEQDLLDRCSPYQRAMVCWAWILRLAYLGWKDADLFPPSLSPIILQCMKARDGIETVHTYQDTQLPFAYVHLITLLVNINNTIVAVKCGVVAAVNIRKVVDGTESSAEYWALINEFLTWFIVPVIYHGLLAISYVIHDPFGEDVLDLPIAAYSKYAFDSCRTMYDAMPCPAEAHLVEPKAVAPLSAPPPPPAQVLAVDPSMEMITRLEQLEIRFQDAVHRQTDSIVETLLDVREGSHGPIVDPKSVLVQGSGWRGLCSVQPSLSPRQKVTSGI
jgi:hypothetical protein